MNENINRLPLLGSPSMRAITRMFFNLIGENIITYHAHYLAAQHSESSLPVPRISARFALLDFNAMAAGRMRPTGVLENTTDGLLLCSQKEHRICNDRTQKEIS